ncbi:hypothetical protein [Rubrobacter aplysinae]|uniref:hypothetical protein n=1 Tax=Rubrobacter aplysinae TaxID=909625 RepID=UPI00128BB0F9|nr:hypothetical protein [Rubrobacter aplysinae]
MSPTRAWRGLRWIVCGENALWMFVACGEVCRVEFLEPRGLRFESAIQSFLDGKCALYQGVNFWKAPDGYLEVRVHSDLRVDEERGLLDDLRFARSIAAEISSGSGRFASAVEGLPWRLIKLDESGTRVIFLYCPEEGKVIWSLGYP